MHTACHLTTRHKSHIFGQQFQKHLLSVSHSWTAYLRATSMNVVVLMGVDKPDWALAQSQPSPNWNFFVGLSIACRRSRHPAPHMRSTKGRVIRPRLRKSSAHYSLHPESGPPLSADECLNNDATFIWDDLIYYFLFYFEIWLSFGGQLWEVGTHLLLSDSSDELCHSFVQRSNIISDPMTILPVYSGFFALLYEVRNGGHL